MFAKSRFIFCLLLALPINTLAAIDVDDDSGELKLEFYGKFHISGDFIGHRQSNVEDLLVSSNASRIGVKGGEQLGGSYRAIWKAEAGVDLSGESSELSPRNRYLGLINPLGMVVAGFHDTPFKSLGAKIDMFPNSIADRRGVLGTGNGSSRMDVRARNVLMYVTPRIAGLEMRVMHSAGQEGDDQAPVKGTDSNSITSYSAVYNGTSILLGAAYEDQLYRKIDGYRVAAGMSLGNAKLNAIYEKLESQELIEFDREAYGVGLAIRVKNTTLKSQVFKAEDYQDVQESSGVMLSAGFSQHLNKSFEIYMVAAYQDNKPNSSFPLRGSADSADSTTGELYRPLQIARDIYGASLGMYYQF